MNDTKYTCDTCKKRIVTGRHYYCYEASPTALTTWVVCDECEAKKRIPAKTIPYTCPICGGKGKVQNGFYSVMGYGSTTNASPENCRSCNGTGIVWGLV